MTLVAGSIQASDGVDCTIALSEAIEHLEHGFALFDPKGAEVLANARFSDAYCRSAPAGVGRPTLAERLRQAFGRAEGDVLMATVKTARAEGQTGLLAERRTDRLSAHVHGIKVFSNTDGSVSVIQQALALEPPQSRSARELFGDAVDNVNFGVALIDEHHRLVFANKKFRANCDPNDELLVAGHTMRQVHADAVRTGLFPVPPGWSTEQLLDLLDHLIDTNARDFPVPNNHGSALVGNVYGTEFGGRILTIQDLTQDRQAEKLMVNAMSRLPVGVAIEDAEGNFTHCNTAFAAPYGLTPDELIAMPGEERMAYLGPQLASIDNSRPAGDLGVAFRAAIQSQRETLAPFEVRFKSGQHFLVERAKTENSGRVVVVTDITALKDAETRNLAAVTDAVQTLDIGIVHFDKNLRITYGNQKWSEIFSSDEVPVRLGDHAIDAIRRQVEAGVYQLPDGVSGDGFIERLTRFIGNYAKNEPLVFSDGRYFLASCHKTRLNGFLISFIDLTEQRAIEKELARQREITRQKERLSALGELVAGVAHELKNPLSIILGYAQMLEDRIEDTVLQRRVDRISEAAERSTRIVEMFLDMAQDRAFDKEPCDLNAIVASALDIAASNLSEQTLIQTEYDELLSAVAGDADQLIQVIYNVIVNAHQAMHPCDRTPMIRLRTFENKAAQTAVVEVSDSGPGIPEALRERVFEPLFSTKEVGEGTGMGLALSHRIVTGHNGSITIGQSDLGGALFEIHIPLASQVSDMDAPC